MFSGLMSTMTSYLFGESEIALEGQFYVNDTLIFMNAGLTLRASDVPYEHDLFVTDEDENEEDAAEFNSYTLTKGMKFAHKISKNDNEIFCWTEGKNQCVFVVNEQCYNKIPELKRDALYRIYEHTYRRPASSASDLDMTSLEREMGLYPEAPPQLQEDTDEDSEREEYFRKPSSPRRQEYQEEPSSPSYASPVKSQQAFKQEDTVPSTPQSQIIGREYNHEEDLPTSPFEQPVIDYEDRGTLNLSPKVEGLTDDGYLPGAIFEPVIGEELARFQANLFIYNLETGDNRLHTKECEVLFNRIDQDDFLTVMYVKKDKSVFVSDSCNSYLNLQPTKINRMIGWNSNRGGNFKFWSLEFPDNDSFDTCLQMMTQFIYENANRKSMGKGLKPEEFEYINNINRGFEMDVDTTDTERDDFEDSSDEEDTISYGATPSKNRANQSAQQNSKLCVSGLHNRTFVTRFNDKSKAFDIGVYSNSHETSDLVFSNSLASVKDTSGAAVTPSKLMLYDGDNSMLMLTPHDPHKILKMDIERGKVIEEWQADPYIKTRDITQSSKLDNFGPTLAGVSSNHVYQIDPRLQGNKIVDEQKFTYGGRTNTRLCCGATTRNGDLVVGSELGEIRMFSNGKLGKRAKTNLPGLGDPIVGIDVSADGRWVLATCEQYLIVVPTAFKKNDREYLGFNEPMGQRKPIPLKLGILPRHLCLINEKIQFTRARFDVLPDGSREQSIVASTGHYVVQWKFDDVRNKKIDAYTIKKFDEIVVADQFTPNNSDHVVVATTNDLGMLNRSDFKTPTSKRLRKNQIVNSPY